MIFAKFFRRRLRERGLGCLRAEHPALVYVLGADVFAMLATAYLEDHPPCSPSLGDLGAHLPSWLARTAPPGVTLPVDVARLERAGIDVLRGPGVEGADTAWLDAPDAAACAALAPSVRLLRLDHPLGPLLSAIHQGEEPPLPPPQPTRLVVARRAF
ncbi:MAG TPA: putative DNA-binding domain-containing protein, partial [Thauera aminoaromatica]|nr:putative DNA-binding domain-containing protein [Thauera aminoaromatica]